MPFAWQPSAFAERQEARGRQWRRSSPGSNFSTGMPQLPTALQQIQVQGGLGMFQRLWVRHCLRLQRGAIVPSSLFGGSLIWLEGLGWLNALAKVAHVRGPGVDDVRELESRHDEEGLPSAVLWF